MPAPALHAQTAGGEEHLDEHKVCRSPVTGIVISVNIGPGQAVQAGDLIVVLEAMKMETNLTAARAGKVKGINVAKGDAVKVGQVVVEFE
jgi:methylmalonyl-CoA carboxyltransferase small subunit